MMIRLMVLDPLHRQRHTDHADDDDDDGDADRFESSSYIDTMISAVDGVVVDRVGMHWWGVVDDLSVGRSDRYDDRADGTDVDERRW